MNFDTIILDKLIVHILDKDLGVPVLSEIVLELPPEIDEFILKHIIKVLKNPLLKEAKFISTENNIRKYCQAISENNLDFVLLTKDLATKFYEQLKIYVDIPNGDLICCLFEMDDVKFLAFLKLNYKESYIHQVKNLETGTLNSIIKQKTTLPNENQKIEECAIINLETYDIHLIEKKFEIDGYKEFYISKNILKCNSDLSGKEKVKILEKTAQEMTTKYYDSGNIDKIVQFKRVVSENIEDGSEVDIKEIADTVFGNIPQVKEEYIAQVEQKGILDKKIAVNIDQQKNLYKKQKIITDTGIEINLLVSEFDNKDKIEFINNEDGTISIVIKNIRQLK
ncbi:hypothetical protein SAMN00017405_0364 [Desulfonispora thiosulfatigenes DSM 11270]|uniref:Nucleoid-associated protein n=1 Tax=Desulfonispora thiosulfatigenes DSM 11270 TaxID=656914 RepID=A0A1W1VPJ6_DESTI|nr:nucleoid-associated protein [Desulfonispora thiosulfatigenes]SMB95278.1 hypothetical protein SAMN00017405_0364 [Desulfonispora thiosulfatigenes DSM 11270]